MMALRGYWRIYAALIVVLKGINGPTGGYWSNLERRVFTRLIRPEDADFAIKFPYLCVPLVQNAPSYETEETSTVEARRQSIYGFVGEERRDYDTDGNERILKLGDDIFRAVSADYKIGGTAVDSRFVSGGTEIGGVIPDDDWAELEKVLEIETRFAAEDLGPNATT